MSKQPKRKFSRELKVAAIKKQVENGFSACEFAEQLEINKNLIYAWKMALTCFSFASINAICEPLWSRRP